MPAGEKYQLTRHYSLVELEFPIAQLLRKFVRCTNCNAWQPPVVRLEEQGHGTNTERVKCPPGVAVMSSSSARKHAGPASDQPAVPQPSFAEQARTLMHLGRVGSLSTLSRKRPGYPFGSVMPYGLDAQGRPILLISAMAMHTQNLQADPRSSLLVTPPGVTSDPLGSSRVTLMGNMALVPSQGVAEARGFYLPRHPNSKYWVDFEDFAFYRMEVVDLYYVGGFGVMGWVPAPEYERAQPDPLADDAAEIIRHMNADHAEALVPLARVFARIDSQSATMTAIDRLGFNLRLQTSDGARGARVAFLREVRNAGETRDVLVEMLKQARLQAE
jgi:heme oxygenase (biliverdin-IX-beta and delta-forming)